MVDDESIVVDDESIVVDNEVLSSPLPLPSFTVTELLPELPWLLPVMIVVVESGSSCRL